MNIEYDSVLLLFIYQKGSQSIGVYQDWDLMDNTQNKKLHKKVFVLLFGHKHAVRYETQIKTALFKSGY